MKKTLILAIVFLFVFTLVSPVLADLVRRPLMPAFVKHESSGSGSGSINLAKPIDKLVGGTVDIVKSPLQIYDHTKSDVDKHKAIGLLTGLITSPFYVARKAGKGAVDMATFIVE